MIERDKQVNDQQKKQSAKKQRREHPSKDRKAQAQPQQDARMTTDPKAAKDRGYAKRMSEKTSKH
jgi:hypothetical protein